MRKTLDFEAVADLVLQGACAVETMADVPPHVHQGEPEGVALVLMHREVPGAVALYGSVRGRVFLVGCFSAAVREEISRRFALDFEFRSHRGPEASVRYLFEAVRKAAESSDASAFDDFRFVCGAEGAELVSELRRLQRIAAGSSHGVLH